MKLKINEELKKLSVVELIEKRYQKYREVGEFSFKPNEDMLKEEVE